MLPASQVENDSKDQHMQEADGGECITPPPEIKSWADASARFMASVIPGLEKKIIAENAGKPQYSFLNDTDPYHAYYQRRLSELRAQIGPVDDSNYLKLKRLIAEAKKKETGNNKKITTSEWIEEVRKRCMERIAAAEAKTVASPITGELIPAYKMHQHLQDPKFKEQKDRLFAKIRETRTAAQDDQISFIAAWLATSRPDVFGTTELEFVYAVKAQIQCTTLLGVAAAAAVVSPFLSEVMVPVDDMYQHMQDPKYKEQKERLFAKIRCATHAEDPRILTAIAWLAQIRPDVFGTTEEEFCVAVKIEIRNTAHRLKSSSFPLDAQCSTPPQKSEPKRQRLDDSLPVPEDLFLA